MSETTISTEQALKYAGQDEYTDKYNDYLKDVIFLHRDPMGILNEKLANNLKKIIMEKSFTNQENYFAIAYNNISKVLPTNEKIENEYKKNTKVEINISKINDVNSEKDEWIPGIIMDFSGDDNNMIYNVKTDDGKEVPVENKNFIHLPNWRDCVKDCYSMCHDYVKNEVESTAYMLRILTASVLGDTENYKICFFTNKDVLNYPNLITGKWKDDMTIFQIQICKVSTDGKTVINETNPENGKFILGAGPSASGKTYNAGLIIKMMKMVDSSFPDFFMTIDGGTYREKSVIYQTIVDTVKNKNQYPGLTNLMSASITDKFRGVQSIFETDTIKKVINDYLLEQTKNKQEKFVVSLYVPDTLTYCGIPTNCKSKLKKYIDITGDNNWIGLMIYQHKTGGDGCPFRKEYKCVGCTESGKSREKTEGKKYSSGAWKMSYDHGLETIKQAPNYRIVFHNGGKPNATSIFEDLSTQKIPYDTIKDFFNKNNIVYIDGELTQNPDCDDYLLKDCKIHKTPQGDQDVLRIDTDFVDNYKNKYIGIPKKLIDILDSKNFDNMDDETVALLLIIQKFMNSGFFVLTEVDPQKIEGTEAEYNYYRINMDNFDYYNDYDDFETLRQSDNIKIYEKETKIEKETEMKPASVWNFLSAPSVSILPSKKSKIDEEVNKTEVLKLDKVIEDNPGLKEEVNNADIVVVNDNDMSEKIKNEFGQQPNIEFSTKTDEKTGEPITIVNVKGDKTSFMKWFTETIQRPVQSLSGLFINRELIDAKSESQGENQDESRSEIKRENVPLVITSNDLVNNSSSKKRYIGIPKTLDNTNDNEDLKNHKKETLEYLIKENVITKINVNQELLNNLNGYNEILYDYYELDIDNFIKSQVEFTIRMKKLELTAAFETLSTNNTLYIYDNEVKTETESTIMDNATNESASSFFGSILGRITGKKEQETKEDVEEEKGDESNDKPPKCKKNKTAKKSAEGKTGKSKTKKNNEEPTRSSSRNKTPVIKYTK